MSTLADLHRRYNGPIPENELAAAKAGGPERLARLRARGRLHFWRQQVKWALAAVRVYRRSINEGRRRPDHDYYTRLFADLHGARKQYKAHWRAVLAAGHATSVPVPAASRAPRAPSNEGAPPGATPPEPGVAMMRDFGRALLNEAAE